MTSCYLMHELKHKILLALTALTIFGEVASIILWIVNPSLPADPSARFTLTVDYTVAVADAAVFAAINSIAMVLIAKRNKMGALLLIIASILNRIISQPIFVGGAHGVFITWTALLVIFAYVEYRGLSNYETAFLSLGALVDLALTGLLFSATENAGWGLAFYFVVLAVLVGIVAGARKLR